MKTSIVLSLLLIMPLGFAIPKESTIDKPEDRKAICGNIVCSSSITCTTSCGTQCGCDVQMNSDQCRQYPEHPHRIVCKNL